MPSQIGSAQREGADAITDWVSTEGGRRCHHSFPERTAARSLAFLLGCLSRISATISHPVGPPPTTVMCWAAAILSAMARYSLRRSSGGGLL